jgi:cell division protein FtsW (lipid II flippase)
MARRRELSLLVFSAVVSTLGMALVCLALGQSPLRALRATAVGAGFVVASLLLGLRRRPRDAQLLGYVSLLCGLGVVLLWRIDPLLASRQVIWMLLGLAAMLATYLLVDDVTDLARYKYTAGAVAVALLLATMVLGHESHGARLWLGLPGLFMFQPAEVAKVLMCLFLAGYVAEKGPLIRAQVASRRGLALPGLKYVGPLIVMVIFSLAIFVLQRDLGAAALFFGLFAAVTYLATGRKTYVFLSLVLFVVGMVAATHAFGHVHARMVAWLNPWADAQGGGYQVLQSLFSLAAGGASGVGLGNGFPELLPAAGTDMIFSVAGEELGLAGTFALLLLFVLVITRSFALASHSRHPYGALLAACLATVFGLQTLVIVGGCLRLLPLTGITLPFVSYGGTSVVVNFIALGLLLAVSRDCVPAAAEA